MELSNLEDVRNTNARLGDGVDQAVSSLPRVDRGEARKFTIRTRAIRQAITLFRRISLPLVAHRKRAERDLLRAQLRLLRAARSRRRGLWWRVSLAAWIWFFRRYWPVMLTIAFLVAAIWATVTFWDELVSLWQSARAALETLGNAADQPPIGGGTVDP